MTYKEENENPVITNLTELVINLTGLVKKHDDAIAHHETKIAELNMRLKDHQTKFRWLLIFVLGFVVSSVIFNVFK